MNKIWNHTRYGEEAVKRPRPEESSQPDMLKHVKVNSALLKSWPYTLSIKKGIVKIQHSHTSNSIFHCSLLLFPSCYDKLGSLVQLYTVVKLGLWVLVPSIQLTLRLSFWKSNETNPSKNASEKGKCFKIIKDLIWYQNYWFKITDETKKVSLYIFYLSCYVKIP